MMRPSSMGLKGLLLLFLQKLSMQENLKREDVGYSTGTKYPLQYLTNKQGSNAN